MYLPDFHEDEVVLDVDVPVVAGVADVLIGLGEVLAEGLVGVDDCEPGGVPAELASAHVQVPKCLRNEEVVVLHLSVEVVGRDVEDGLATVEVQVHPVALGHCGLPGQVVLVGVEGMHGIAPGLLEPLDLRGVLFLAHGDDQVLVLDGPAVAQHYLAAVGIEPLDSNVVRLGVVFAEGLARGVP